MIKPLGMQNLGFGRVVKVGKNNFVNPDDVKRLYSPTDSATLIYFSKSALAEDHIKVDLPIDKVANLINTKA
ncbi:MAG: hypothetical protein WCG23_02150 [bacterium]